MRLRALAHRPVAATARRSTPRALAAAVATLAGVAVGTAPSTASAQGFGLNEIGSCAIGRGFAVTGAPCEDASVLYWNPGAAAPVAPRGLSVYAGAAAVQVKGSFQEDFTRRTYPGDVPIETPPFVGATWKGRNSRLALGVAAFVPYGLTSQWEDDFIGRFSAQKASLASIYVQPTISYELVPGFLSVGGGPVIGHSTLELRQALDLSTVQPPGTPPGTTFGSLGFARGTEFARARVKGTATGYGYNLGVHLRMSEHITAGARYLSQVRFDYDGAEATFTPSPLASGYVLAPNNPLGLPGGTTVAQLTAPQFASNGLLRPGQEASTRIDHPSQFQFGVGWRNAGTTLSGDYAIIRWKSFQELPVNFGASSPLTRVLREDYVNSHSWRLGAEHRYRSGLAARLGGSYATSPAPDVTVTPLLPDMDRYNFNAGVALPLGARFVVDAGYLRVETKGRRGRTGERVDESLSAERINNGWYALNANIFSLSLKARF